MRHVMRHMGHKDNLELGSWSTWGEPTPAQGEPAPHRKALVGIKPTTFLLCGDSANHWTAVPYCSKTIYRVKNK